MALDLTTGLRGLTALGDVVARWLSHLIAIGVVVEPLAELQKRAIQLVCRTELRRHPHRRCYLQWRSR